MLKNHFLVVARLHLDMEEVEAPVRTFESKNLAFSFAEICNSYTYDLFCTYQKIKEIPLDTELIDENLRSYHYWPNYAVKTVTVANTRPALKGSF